MRVGTTIVALQKSQQAQVHSLRLYALPHLHIKGIGLFFDSSCANDFLHKQQDILIASFFYCLVRRITRKMLHNVNKNNLIEIGIPECLANLIHEYVCNHQMRQIIDEYHQKFIIHSRHCGFSSLQKKSFVLLYKPFYVLINFRNLKYDYYKRTPIYKFNKSNHPTVGKLPLAY